MPPDPTPARTVGENGVALWRFLTHDGSVTYRTYCPSGIESDALVALPMDEAADLVLKAQLWDGFVASQKESANAI